MIKTIQSRAILNSNKELKEIIGKVKTNYLPYLSRNLKEFVKSEVCRFKRREDLKEFKKSKVETYINGNILFIKLLKKRQAGQKDYKAFIANYKHKDNIDLKEIFTEERFNKKEGV